MTADSDTGPKPATASFSSGAVAVSDRQQDWPVDQDRWAGLMHRVIAEEGVATLWEAGLSFVAADEMTVLNVTHRGVDRPTDVLAFGTDDGSAPRAAAEPRLVGDVVICPSVAASNAAARNMPVDDEVALLVVHGTLHLLGYDHIDDVDAHKMEKRERELLASNEATASGRQRRQSGPQWERELLASNEATAVLAGPSAEPT